MVDAILMWKIQEQKMNQFVDVILKASDNFVLHISLILIVCCRYSAEFYGMG